jgi:hypothetical protein
MAVAIKRMHVCTDFPSSKGQLRNNFKEKIQEEAEQSDQRLKLIWSTCCADDAKY